MQTETTHLTTAGDVPEWLLAYADKLDWSNAHVAAAARAQVKKYMRSLPQKNHAWQHGTCKELGDRAIPMDVLSDISSVNWNAVPLMVQQGMRAMLPAL